MYEQGDTVCDCLYAVENFLWEMTLNSVTPDGKSWNKSWNSYIYITGWVLDSEIWGMDLAIQNLKNNGIIIPHSWVLVTETKHDNVMLYCAQLLSCVQLFVTPWTVTCQALCPWGFSRQGLPFPSPGHLPYPGIKPRSPTLQADSLNCPFGHSVYFMLHAKGLRGILLVLAGPHWRIVWENSPEPIFGNIYSSTKWPYWWNVPGLPICVYSRHSINIIDKVNRWPGLTNQIIPRSLFSSHGLKWYPVWIGNAALSAQILIISSVSVCLLSPHTTVKISLQLLSGKFTYNFLLVITGWAKPMYLLFFFIAVSFLFQIHQQENNPKAQTVASGWCLPTDHVALVFTASSIVHCWNDFGRTSSLSTWVGAFIFLTEFLKEKMVQSQFSSEKSGGGGRGREEQCKQNFYPTRTLFSLVPLSVLTKLAHLASDANHSAWPLHCYEMSWWLEELPLKWSQFSGKFSYSSWLMEALTHWC